MQTSENTVEIGKAGGITPSGVQELLKDELTAVEKSIYENFQSSVAIIPVISKYLASGGGKRLRPMLVLATSRLCGYDPAKSNGKGKNLDVIHSTVIEYIHAASLLHDDVVDTSELRRGISSANAKWGNQYPVLVGDFLFSKSFDLMAKHSPPGIIEAVSEATTHLAEGQILELVHNADVDIGEEKYIDLIYRKTGALITACCRIGGFLGGADEKEMAALAEYGRNIGIAFQLVDDILDFVSDEKTLGKPVCQDVADGHVTLPLIHAFENGDPKEREFLRETVRNENLVKERIGTITGLIDKYDGIGYAREKAEGYVESALVSLEAFPSGYYIDALKGLAEYIVYRKM